MIKIILLIPKLIECYKYLKYSFTPINPLPLQAFYYTPYVPLTYIKLNFIVTKDGIEQELCNDYTESYSRILALHKDTEIED